MLAKRKTQLVLAGVALSLVVPLSVTAQDPAKQIIDEMIAALGGEAYLNVREIHTTGRFYSFQRGQLAGGDEFVDYIKFPDMERTEFGRDKNKSVTINSGEEGWTIEGDEVEPQVPGQVEEFQAHFRTSFDYVLRFGVNDLETTLQRVGTEMINFTRADIVELRDAERNLIRLYVDRNSRLPLKMQVRRANEREIYEEQYANWHSLQGVLTPLLTVRYTDGAKTMEIRLDTATYNSGLPPSLFAPSVQR